ncbi:MAG: hypothetical protein ACOZDD_11740 [Bacteroidota bacterium]
MMVRKYLLLILIITGSISANAGDKVHALGLRGGISSGFEYRYYLSSANSVKLLLSTRDRGIQLHGLYEQHANDIFDFSGRLTLVYGGGIHAGYESWNRSYYVGHTRYTESVSRPLAGFDLLAGLEYPFLIFPFSVGFEVKPYVDFWGKNYVRVQPFDFAFTFKFHFN